MLNVFDLIKSLGALPGRSVASAAAALPEKTLEGNSAGNLVRVKCSTRMQVKDITIDESLMKPDQKLFLEEMLASTINEVMKKTLAELDALEQKAAAEAGAKAMNAVPPDMMRKAMDAVNASNGSFDEAVKKMMQQFSGSTAPSSDAGAKNNDTPVSETDNDTSKK